MATTNPSPLLRLLPSLTDAAFLLPVIIIYGRLQGAKLLLGDGDTGWHIRTGEWILANGRVPQHDIFSYTKEGAPWFAWEWLWDVLFARLHQWGGLAAVVLGSLLVLCFTFALLYRLVRRHCFNDLLAFAITALAAMGSSIHWLARPHVFTLLFVVLFLHILERVQEGRTRLLWLLPALTILWVNLHGGFFVGIFLVGCYAGGRIFSWLIDPDRAAAQTALQHARPYVYTALGCLAASFLNPYSYHLHLHIWNYLRDPYLFQHIQEFQATSFQHPTAYYYGPLLLLGVLAAAWGARERRYERLLLLSPWIWLALYAVRNVPIAMLVCAPAVAGLLDSWLGWLKQAQVASWWNHTGAAFQELSAEFSALDRSWRLHLASAAVFVAAAVLHFLPAPPEKFTAHYDPKRYPEKALTALGDPAHAGRIFTHDEWGDYLIYKLYPRLRVFVDGRSDMYGEAFNRQFLNVMNVKPGWRETLARHRVDTVLLPVDAPLTGALKESAAWRVTYDDGLAIVFRQTGLPPEAQLAGTGTDSAHLDSRAAAQADRQDCPPPAPRGEQVSVSSHSEDREDHGGRAAARINSNRDPRIMNLNRRSEPTCCGTF